MPEQTYDLLGVYVDGETKTGKGAASKAIAASLKEEGLKVYYDVAGDFFRRYVALVREHLGLSESDPLPTGEVLQTAARDVHQTRKAFQNDIKLGDLQRPIISQSVAVLGELPYVQTAGAEWWALSLQLAKEGGVDIIVIDGRNPRSKVKSAANDTGIRINTALDLFMTCEAGEAARRSLRLEGVVSPNSAQLEIARQRVELRRKQDRERSKRPFIVPAVTLLYDPLQLPASKIIAESWQAHGDEELPITIQIDNTNFTEAEMLSAVRDLAKTAIKFIKQYR